MRDLTRPLSKYLDYLVWTINLKVLSDAINLSNFVCNIHSVFDFLYSSNNKIFQKNKFIYGEE